MISTGKPFHGHIDRTAFERAMREGLNNIPPAATAKPAPACQLRGKEATIQFALWIADELNAGTSPDVLLDAGSRVLGDMVANFARGFAEKPGENMIAHILDRIHWQTTSDDDDCLVEIARPQQAGGRA